MTDRERRFWFKHTDEELSLIASDMMGHTVAASVFAVQREQLLGKTTRV